MPCIFLSNVPSSFTTPSNLNWCKTTEVFEAQQLYGKIAKAAGCQERDIEIHLSSEKYKLLTGAGFLVDCPNIHGSVEWHGSEKRDFHVKQKIADALQHYLNQFGIGEGFDIAFHDSPAGTFFVEKDGKSVMVEGGENQIDALKKEIADVRRIVHGQMVY